MPGSGIRASPATRSSASSTRSGSGVKGWSVGARAGVGWFGGSCGYCSRCRRDSAFACENVHEVIGRHPRRRLRHPYDRPCLGGRACAGRPRRRRVGPAAVRRRSPPSTRCAMPAPDPGDLVAVHRRRRPRASRHPVRRAAGLPHRRRQPRAATRRSSRGSSGRATISTARREDPAKALTAMGGARAILATVTDGKAMQAIVGGLGPNGV